MSDLSLQSGSKRTLIHGAIANRKKRPRRGAGAGKLKEIAAKDFRGAS
jgi:hypothetical protein